MKGSEKFNLQSVVSNPRWVLALAIGLLALPIMLLLAQTTGPGTGQGRTSAPNELQRDPKPEARAAATALSMEDNRPTAQLMIAGKVRKMEELLARPVQASVSNRQPAVSLRASAAVLLPAIQEAAPQPTRATAVAAGASHLHLVLRLTEGGGVEVLSAAEIPGEAAISEEAVGDYVYEVASDSQTLAAQAVADPFEMRSFPGPEGSPFGGHHTEQAKTATIVVKVPRMNLSNAALNNLVVRLYKITEGTTIERMNPTILRQLKLQNRLDLKIDVLKGKLAPGIRQKGVRISP